MTAPLIGGVAGITQKRLEQAWVRRLVHQYCHDYVTLPCASSLLGVVLGHAHGMAALSPDEMPCHSRNAGGDDMIGESAAMQAMPQMLQQAATTEAPVYIAGETGTGKELAALASHRHSPRSEPTFGVTHLRATPQTLVKAALFGSEPRAA